MVENLLIKQRDYRYLSGVKSQRQVSKTKGSIVVLNGIFVGALFRQVYRNRRSLLGQGFIGTLSAKDATVQYNTELLVRTVAVNSLSIIITKRHISEKETCNIHALAGKGNHIT